MKRHLRFLYTTPKHVCQDPIKRKWFIRFDKRVLCVGGTMCCNWHTPVSGCNHIWKAQAHRVSACANAPHRLTIQPAPTHRCLEEIGSTSGKGCRRRLPISPRRWVLPEPTQGVHPNGVLHSLPTNPHWEPWYTIRERVHLLPDIMIAFPCERHGLKLFELTD